MRYPSFGEEKRLWRKGYKIVVGLDEAGRGPLAGPVVAVAVVINSKFLPAGRQGKTQNLKIKDSKKLTARQREYFYKILTTHPQIKWGTGRVSEKVIDKINILEATKMAMKRAVRNLEKKIGRGAEFLILDGNFKINSDISRKSIIKADEKVFSCAAASIIAKVLRDKMMLKYHKKYPRYGFDKNKGYPTKFHRETIKKIGFCFIHRQSFRVS